MRAHAPDVVLRAAPRAERRADARRRTLRAAPRCATTRDEGAPAPPPPLLAAALGGARAELLTAVVEQARRDAWPRVTELLEPWLAPPPAPLTDTVPPEALADAESLFASVLGVNVHYKLAASEAAPAGEASRDDSPLVLCLHGLNGSTFSFRDVLAGVTAAAAAAPGLGATSRRLRVAAFDRPPFGLTSRPLGGAAVLPDGTSAYSDAGGAALALALAAHLGAKRFVLLGHSAGAGVALAAARSAPAGSCAGLVLVSPAVPASDQARDSFLGRADAGTWARLSALRALLSQDGPGLNYVRAQLTKRAAAVRASRDVGYAANAPAPPHVVEGYLAPMRARDWDAATLAQFRALSFAPPPPPRAGELRALDAAGEERHMPLLIVQGAEDTITPAPAARRLAAALGPACTYVELPRVGHLPMEEAPEAWLAAVVPFVAEALWGSGSTASGRDAPAAEAAAGNGAHAAPPRSGPEAHAR